MSRHILFLASWVACGGGGDPQECEDLESEGIVPEILSGSTAQGTSEVRPSCDDGPHSAADVQIPYTAPTDGTYLFDLAGSDYDTVLSVLDACGGIELACDDDSAGNLQARLVVDLVAGQQVIVNVDGGGGASGNFELFVVLVGFDEVSCDDGYDNDSDFGLDCNDRDCDLDPACAEVCDDGIDNDDDGEVDCDDVYCDGNAACLETCDDEIDNDGDSFPDCTDPDCDFDPACAEICDDGIDNDGDGAFDCGDLFCAADPACVSVCPDVVALGTVPEAWTGNTLGNTDDVLPTCTLSSIAGDVQIDYTAPVDGEYLFDLSSNDHDTVLSILDACDGAQLACNDDNGASLGSRLVVPLLAGQQVIINVDGFLAGEGNFALFTFLLEDSEASCDDGQDNDFDGQPDCLDTDCGQAAACDEVCDDEIDNDTDGDTDCSDSDCDNHPACP